MKKVIVIGGGPAGMMAAIASARSGAKTTLLEAGPKPGRKLLLTGNGRCNLTNLDTQIRSVYDSADPSEAKTLVNSVFSGFDTEDLLQFFRNEGLLTMTEHGSYVYPVTAQSSTVLEVLLRAMKALDVKLKYSEEVIEIERVREDASGMPSESGWNVRTKTWTYTADRVILACGSRAVPSTGSNGSGYELCRMLGLDVTDILPALTAVSCSLYAPDAKAYVPGSARRQGRQSESQHTADPLSDASGTRTLALVTVLADGEQIAQERGQVQFTKQDLSGIVVYNLSRFVVRALHRGCEVTLSLDLVPDTAQDVLDQTIKALRKKYDGISDDRILCGLVSSRLIPAVLALSRQSGQSLAHVLKHFLLKASALRDFDSAQVCAGGVRVTELHAGTLECRAQELKGIYLAGELIDVDGPCGGYDLQWAFSSGYVGGLNAAMEP